MAWNMEATDEFQAWWAELSAPSMKPFLWRNSFEEKRLAPRKTAT